MSKSRQNKVLENAKAPIQTHANKIPLQLKLASAGGAVRGEQSNNILAIYRQFAIGHSTLTDSGTITPDNDGFYQFLNSPSTVKGIKVADQKEYLTGIGSNLASNLYENWSDTAMDAVEEHGLKAMTSALNIVEQQRKPFQRMVYTFIHGNSNQVDRLVKELASRDTKATLTRLRDLLETLSDEVAHNPNQEGGYYTDNGKEFEFSMVQVADRQNAITIATKKYEETIENDEKILALQIAVLDRRHQVRLDAIIADGRQAETKTETRVKNDLEQVEVDSAINAIDNLLENVQILTK